VSEYRKESGTQRAPQGRLSLRLLRTTAMKNQPGRGPCYADPQERARRAGRSLGTAMADHALTLERKCGYTSGSYAVQIEP
jgi:hypothetical protein